MNVLAGYEQDCGATYFNLSYLQVPGVGECAYGMGQRGEGRRISSLVGRWEMGGLNCASCFLAPAHRRCLRRAPVCICTLHVLADVPQDEYKDEPGTVIAADFYGASRLLPLSGAPARPLAQPAADCCCLHVA